MEFQQRPFFIPPTVQSSGTFTYQNVLFLCRLYLSVRISGSLAILKRFFFLFTCERCGNNAGLAWLSDIWGNVFRFLLGLREKWKCVCRVGMIVRNETANAQSAAFVIEARYWSKCQSYCWYFGKQYILLDYRSYWISCNVFVVVMVCTKFYEEFHPFTGKVYNLDTYIPIQTE